MEHLRQVDPAVAEMIDGERDRQQNSLELIASENHASAAVIEAAGTVLTDKYAEGYPGKRYYGGCEFVDQAEQLAIDRAKQLFGADHVNVQPHCGASANMAVYLAALKPGEKVLGMDLAHGGHLSHGMKLNFSGRLYEIASYGVDEKTETIDMDALAATARREKPQLIIAGASAYPRTLDFEAFGRIAKEVGALLLADIAHIAGLIATGVHPTPVGHADFITTTTHKTLRGPRGGMVMCTDEWAKKINSAVFPGLQGGPLEHIIAAKAVAFGEALQPSFKEYTKQILANAATLAKALAEKGWRIVSGGTDNHLLLVDLRTRCEDLTGAEAERRLESAGIVCNKNLIPFDTRPPMQASGLRFGTPALTTRGMTEPQMLQLAEWIDSILIGGDDEALLAKVRDGVGELCGRFPIPAIR